MIAEQQLQSQLMSVKQQQASASSVKPTDKLVLLADIEFFEFPLEALSVFHDCPQFCSITRDFSLQFFATRYFSQKEAGKFLWSELGELSIMLMVVVFD